MEEEKGEGKIEGEAIRLKREEYDLLLQRRFES